MIIRFEQHLIQKSDDYTLQYKTIYDNNTLFCYELYKIFYNHLNLILIMLWSMLLFHNWSNMKTRNISQKYIWSPMIFLYEFVATYIEQLSYLGKYHGIVQMHKWAGCLAQILLCISQTNRIIRISVQLR